MSGSRDKALGAGAVILVLGLLAYNSSGLAGEMVRLVGTLAGVKAQDATIQLRADDAAMTEAVAAAKGSRATFLAEAADAPESWSDVTVKVALQGARQIENIWISNFERLDETLSIGLLANDPVDMPGSAAGDPVEFRRDQIVDWAFVENARGYGFYTVRALLPRMEPEQAAAMESFLAEDPLPAGW